MQLLGYKMNNTYCEIYMHFIYLDHVQSNLTYSLPPKPVLN